MDILNKTDIFFNDASVFFSNLGFLAAKIANHNFEWRYVTVIMFQTVHVIGLQTFLMNYDRSVIVKLNRIVPEHRIQVAQFVIFGQTSTEIITTLRWLHYSKYEISGKYIIICPYSDIYTCDERQIFQTLANLYIVNVVLLKQGENDKPLIYTYEIVKPGKCTNMEPQLHDWVPDCQEDKCFQSIFYEKLKNIYKCPLYISALQQPPFMYLNANASNPSGGDGEFIKLIASVINATLIMRKPTDVAHWGDYKNNNWTGSLGDVFNSRAHASMCSAPLTSYKYGNFQISATYYSNEIVWVARLPSLRASWEKMLYPFKSNLHVILIFTFLGIIFFYTLTKANVYRLLKKCIKAPLFQFKHNWLFYSWALFLGMPLSKMPVRTTFRILIFTWIYFCIIIRSAYLAALITSLKHPRYQSLLRSSKDIVRLPYGGVTSLREYYINNPDVYDRWTIVEFADTFAVLDEILEGKTDFVLAINKDVVKHHVFKYNGSKLLQIVPEKIVISPVVIYFKKYSSLTAPVNEIIIKAFEAGFIQHFYKKYLMNEKELQQKLRKYGIENLSMNHFSGCFAILIMGYCLSFIYFIVEVICGNLHKIH